MTIVGAAAEKSFRNGPSAKRTTRQPMSAVNCRCRASRKRTSGPPLRVASWLTRITWGRVPLGSQEARIIGRSKPIRFRARYCRHASCRIVVIPLNPGIEPVKSATLLPKFINSFFHYLTAEGNKRIPQDIVPLTTLQILSAPARTPRLICALPKLNHKQVRAVGQRPRSPPATKHRLMVSFQEPIASGHPLSLHLPSGSEFQPLKSCWCPKYSWSAG